MRIAVDAMGGDRAPGEVVSGAVTACTQPGQQVVLVGQPDAIRECIGHRSYPREALEIVPAEETVGMGDPPASALRRPRTSLAVAVNLVREGDCQAVVSAGNSGAFMGLATVRLDRAPGVERPAIAIVVPTPAGPRVVLDVGANATCKPEHLVQFAHMGYVYARNALAIPRPRVGLLSIGEEASKGSELTKATHKLLSEIGAELNFVGNIEGDTAFEGRADVVVCDGFSGNVLLKAAEGMAGAIMAGLREALTRDWRTKLAAWMLRGALREFRSNFDYASYGGTLLLGVKGTCVVCHGRSGARAIASAIAVARRAVETRVIDQIADACAGTAKQEAAAVSQGGER
jgi:glycerol-3-phosphate acyltransferase PlsX